jgi:L-2-hydroxyglutarate oxidase LhgO
MDRLDCIIVGAGVVGLSIARSLALAGREVVVLEAEPQVGMHASSRNSEVIHAGLYYAEGSLKARLCVTGKEMLYRYCEAHQVTHDRIGKLIVAGGHDDLTKLEAIQRQARLNGVDDLRFLSVAEMAQLEPAIVGHGALFSPSTGIIDSHELMSALQAEIENAGGSVLLNTKVTGVAIDQDELHFDANGERFSCNTLVNAAGLGAQELVAGIKGWDTDQGTQRDCRIEIPARHLAKGHYFAYQGKSPFKHLVYPVPIPGGLGIHATNDLAGAVRFGPDVMWVENVDYSFDESRKEAFVAAIQRYFPDLEERKLSPAYTGIRSKVAKPGGASEDFRIDGPREHGIPGLVSLFGIESPGLTACLAIGEYVAKRLE